MTNATDPDFAILMDKPKGWADRSMTIYAFRTKSGFDANIVLARDAMLTSETFESYAGRQHDTFLNSLPGFALESRQEGLVNDFPAHEMLFTWDSGQGRLQQRAVFISVGKGRIATYASTATVDDYPAMQKQFDDAFATLSIDGGETPAPLTQFMR